VCRVNDKPLVALALTDSLRPAAKSMLADLRKMGVEPVLASGDRQAVVQEMAQSLGIQGFGEQSPQMKAQYVAGLQAQGKRVAMLGDGINDAPALARADVGIAMGSGTDAAQQTAAITLKNATLPNVLTAFRLSKATFRNIKQNLVWAFGYNIVLIPMAITGKLTPMWAAAAMAFSSVFVVLNSLRLLRFESRDTE
jgi:Cu+-exporting ATPase